MTQTPLSPQIVPQQTIVSPSTGEVLAPDSPVEDLGRFLTDVRSHESEVREAKRTVTRWVVARMDSAASWSLHAPGFKLTAPSPKPTEQFDGPALREALLPLVDEGVLSVEAVDAAVEPVVTYEPRKRGINALRKLGGRVEEIVNAHATPVEKERYVTVTPTTASNPQVEAWMKPIQ